jgi:CCR4-NOT transcription complex subunit 3
VQSADTQNLKEKHEMDLKKEIKKLQRLRDQIKTWVSSTEVKDKDALVEARKLIETKMEQFKICEKETKTKTYSKEGLAREDKMDPEEEAKLRTTSWLAEYVERFQQQVEEKDFDIEKLSAGKGKKQNKHQIEALQLHIAHHKFHITKLEGIIRLINNDVLETDPVDSLQEDLDYYLDSYQEEDYIQVYDQDFFYESLGLDELELVNVDRLSQPVVPPKKGDDATDASSKESKELKNGKKAASSVIPMTIGRARSKAEKKADQEREESEALAALTPVKKPVASPPPAPAPVVASPPVVQAGTSMAAILKRESEQQEKERQKVCCNYCICLLTDSLLNLTISEPTFLQQMQLQQEQLRQQQLQQQQQQEQLRQEALRVQQLAAQEALQRQQQEALRLQQQEAAQQQALQRAAAEQKAQSTLPPPQQPQPNKPTSALDLLSSGLGGLGLGGGPLDSRIGGEAPGSASVGGVAVGGTLELGGTSYLSALNESFAAAPSAGDTERSRPYTPQNPYPTPASYPATPSAIFDTPAVFEKLGTDCLFFIFYYAQGTYQQYLAARELKKQSWRFHKKYMTWFQRHEEPKITTDEYEQGTYVYFDYETGWCTRIKQDFRFEYSFLEDSLQ